MELNKSKSNLENKYWEMCQEVVHENNLKLYDVEYINSSSTLRVFIFDEKTKTADLDDCVKIDRAMTPYLEADWVSDKLVLEVSSPGMFRPLKEEKHFELAKDENVLAVLNDKIEGVKGNKIRGKLKDFDKESFKLDIGGDEVTLPLVKVKKVNLDPDY